MSGQTRISADGATSVVAFRGRVECRRAPQGPLGLTLTGFAADAPDEALHVSFTGNAPTGLPATLGNVRVEQLGPALFVIDATEGRWEVEATAMHVHHDVGAAFFRAVPPRRAPLRKRIFWRAVLAAAGNPLVRRLFLARRVARADTARTDGGR